MATHELVVPKSIPITFAIFNSSEDVTARRLPVQQVVI
jgi:hypothetical protein